MTVAAEVTEALHSTALLAECRRCLSIGVDLKSYYIKQVIGLIENVTIADLSAWTDKAVNNQTDGRNTAEVAVIT